MRFKILILLLLSNSVFATENPPIYNHDNVRWNRLVYEASAFFITLETEIRLSTIDRKAAVEQLVLQDETNLLFPEGQNVYRIDTFADSFGKKTHYSLWFDSDGEILQRKKVLRGKKNEIKIYRFSPCAYYSLRKKFPDKKFDQEFSQWTAANQKFQEFQPELCGDEPIVDANTLLYLISALDIKDAGFDKELLTFSRGRLIKVRLKAIKKTSIYSEFKVKHAAGSNEIEDDVDVLQLHLSPVVDNSKDRDNFRFLGLKGNIKIYVDTRRKLILRLSGNVDVVGSIDINLRKAELIR